MIKLLLPVIATFVGLTNWISVSNPEPEYLDCSLNSTVTRHFSAT